MAMTIIIDVVLLALVLIGFIVGIVRGFMKSVAGPLKFFGSIAIAFWLDNPISSQWIEPLIGGTLANHIEGYLLKNCADPGAELPTLIKLAASLVGVDLEGKTIREIVIDITAPAVSLVSVILTFIIVYFVARLLLALVFLILNKVFDSSALVVPNKIAGCILNTLMGAIAAWGFAFIFNFIIHLPAFEGQEWVASFTAGPIFEFFVRLSPIELLLSF